MAIAFVQAATYFESAAAGSSIATNAIATTTDNLLVAGFRWGGGQTITGISDTASSTWTLVNVIGGSNSTTAVYFAADITGNAANIVTVTLSGSPGFRAA